MTVFDWLWRTGVSSVPSIALVWVNKLIGFFKNSPDIAYYKWRPDADGTAAALGTVTVIVFAVIVSLIPRRWLRGGLAVLFLVATGFAVWKCYDFHTLLDTRCLIRSG
jgi:hypothetical protein